MILIETAKFILTVNQVVLATTSLLAGVLIIFFFRTFLRRKRIRALFGIKHSKTMLNFVYIVFGFFALYACLEALGLDFKGFLSKTIVSTPKIKVFFYHIFVFYLIVTGTKVLIYIIEGYVNRKPASSHIEKGKSESIYQIIKYFIYVIAIALFVESLGFNITILIASFSALLIGLGLGIQHIFNDFVSGFIILFDRSIKIGDVVEIDETLVGQVMKINLRTSMIITRDDVEVIIPNGKFTTENVTNWTHNSIITRFNIVVGVAYGSDVRLVENILIEAAKGNKFIVKKPNPIVHFINFGDSSLDFKLLFYSEDNFRIEKIKSDLRFVIDQKFRDNNVTIPFPQRDVHHYKD
jgi:small-conductance mechanosensitive channel